MANTFSLKDKVAVITGGGRGIGKEIALAYAEAGADIAVAARTLGQIEKTAEEIRRTGRRALAVQTDTSKKNDVNHLVQEVMDRFGRIDILVNNAGIMIKAPILEMKEEDWDRLFDISLKGYFLCAQAVGKRMVEQGKGIMINISSQYAYRVTPGMGAYSVVKTGVVMLTRVLARELGSHGIRVNAIAPGLIKTDFSKPSWSNPEFSKQYGASVPMGRIGECEDIVGAALLLASDASSYVTGSTLLIDGGAMA